MRRKITMRINLIAWIVGTERRVNDGSGDGILCIVVAVCKASSSLRHLHRLR